MNHLAQQIWCLCLRRWIQEECEQCMHGQVQGDSAAGENNRIDPWCSPHSSSTQRMTGEKVKAGFRGLMHREKKTESKTRPKQSGVILWYLLLFFTAWIFDRDVHALDSQCSRPVMRAACISIKIETGPQTYKFKHVSIFVDMLTVALVISFQ